MGGSTVGMVSASLDLKRVETSHETYASAAGALASAVVSAEALASFWLIVILMALVSRASRVSAQTASDLYIIVLVILIIIISIYPHL